MNLLPLMIMKWLGQLEEEGHWLIGHLLPVPQPDEVVFLLVEVSKRLQLKNTHRNYYPPNHYSQDFSPQNHYLPQVLLCSTIPLLEFLEKVNDALTNQMKVHNPDIEKLSISLDLPVTIFYPFPGFPPQRTRCSFVYNR